MRRIVEFQVVPGRGAGETVYVLTHDGVLWRQTKADNAWLAIEPPGDGDPFKPEMTEERLLQRLARGGGFPKGEMK